MADSSEWDPALVPSSHAPDAFGSITPVVLSSVNPDQQHVNVALNQRPPSPPPPPPPTAYPFLTQAYLPPHPFEGTSSSAAGPSTSTAPSLPIIQFDPKASPSDDEEEDDDEDAPAGVPGRPKKRKSVVNLRAANAAASAGGSAPPSRAGASTADEDDKGRRKIQIEYIEEKSKRHITFSKRKAGIMKKAYELSTLTGTQVLLLVVSESGWVYTFTTDKFKPLVKEDENGGLSQGQKLIASCLESKEKSPHLGTGFVPHPPTQGTSNFEANSAIHGGQIALKTNARPGPTRPMATNRRVSSRGRHHIPTAIRTDSMPPVPALPTPMSGYLDSSLQGPISPRERSRSVAPPISPTRGGRMQQQQMGGGQEYAEMLQRAEVLQMQGYDQGGQGYGDPNLVFQSPPPSAHSMNLMSHDQSHFQQQHQQQQQQQQYLDPHHQRMYGDLGYQQPDRGHHHSMPAHYHSQEDVNQAYRTMGNQQQPPR